jgi:hypothetical protein
LAVPLVTTGVRADVKRVTIAVVNIKGVVIFSALAVLDVDAAPHRISCGARDFF